MDPIFLKVLIGTTLLASSAAVVGAFSYLKGQSLVGDAIAHALLPGVVLAFLLGDGRNPIFLIVGALISGLIAHYGIGYIQSRTKLKSDTAVSLVLSTFFGFGIMLMSLIQRSGQGQQAGLERYLLGKAAAITMDDVYVFSALAVLLIVGVGLFYKGFQLMTFNVYPIHLYRPNRSCHHHWYSDGRCGAHGSTFDHSLGSCSSLDKKLTYYVATCCCFCGKLGHYGHLYF